MKKNNKHQKSNDENNVTELNSTTKNANTNTSSHSEKTENNQEQATNNIKIPKDLTQFNEAIVNNTPDFGAIQDKYILLQADFENYKKRSQREKEEIIKYAAGDIVKALLPVLDNFQLGLKAATKHETVAKGFQIIFEQLNNVLQANGVKEIAPKNEAFNPQIHDAVAYITHDQIPSDHVIETLRAGYQLNGKLLRPANVVVSKGKVEE